MENGAASEGRDPSSFLTEIIGAPVTVKLNSGVVYKGELQSVDGYMNIALDKTEEFINGSRSRSYGEAFVRGNNGTELMDHPTSNTKRCITDIESASPLVMYICSDS
ncbi:MAG: U4/U6-U5 snRNP complex subunit lsm6 [Piccolia ochrophora]|nr:MAG: U4/U6-U5 snRNP complex subunit lsm6 [Piccolia ochrophora]